MTQDLMVCVLFRDQPHPFELGKVFFDWVVELHFPFIDEHHQICRAPEECPEFIRSRSLHRRQH